MTQRVNQPDFIMITLGLSIDFNPGHNSELKDAPVNWCKLHLNVETTPDDWEYKGWGIYNSLKPIITQEQKEEVFTNWETKYEGRARGLSIIRF